MKLKTKREIGKISYDLRGQGSQIVTVNGAFDLFHVGHLEILEQAKKQGDYLIVGLNSDSSVKSYKGQNRPIVSEKNRVRLLSALECVDYVTIFDEPEIAVPLIRLVRPLVHVNGAEYGENCVESTVLREIGARLYLVDKYRDFSTSNLIKKIKEL